MIQRGALWARLTGLTHVQGGSNTLNAIVYGLDANGNRTSLTDVDGLTTYVYDAVNRLDVATYPAIPGGPPAATIDYSIDDVAGARWARTSDGATTYTYDASDRITNSGFVYDDNGNLLSDGVKSYQYDAANRLTKVISGSVSIDYGYDGWGNLILESSNGITTEYVLDERGALPTILGEVRSDGTTRLYAYGPEGFAAQMVVGGAVEYPLLDGLGSVRHLTDGSGTVTFSRSYDAFGNLRYSTGTGATHLGYTGELQDQQTGLVYLRARFYHPVLGRFLQRDSFAGFGARPQSLNRYSYTENNPVNYTDPSGHYVDTLFDFGSISYDLYRIVQDNILHDCGNLGQNVFALVLDVGGAALPFATGLGVMYRAGKMARFARWWDDVQMLGKTGIWGGTFRKIASALPDGYMIGVRTRPAMAQLWEWAWKATGKGNFLHPKLVGLAKNDTIKWAWKGFDSGLRFIKQEARPNLRWWERIVHSDIDTQFIIRSEVPETSFKEANLLIERLNKAADDIFQHGDALTGGINKMVGATAGAFDGETALISQSGYFGTIKNGTDALLGLTHQDLREAIPALLEQITWALTR